VETGVGVVGAAATVGATHAPSTKTSISNAKVFAIAASFSQPTASLFHPLLNLSNGPTS